MTDEAMDNFMKGIEERKARAWREEICQMAVESFPNIKYSTIEGLCNYVEKKYRPGGFLQAVLANDLFDAVGRADSENRYVISDIVQLIFNSLPSTCHGSREAIEEWLGDK